MGPRKTSPQGRAGASSRCWRRAAESTPGEGGAAGALKDGGAEAILKNEGAEVAQSPQEMEARAETVQSTVLTVAREDARRCVISKTC